MRSAESLAERPCTKADYGEANGDPCTQCGRKPWHHPAPTLGDFAIGDPKYRCFRVIGRDGQHRFCGEVGAVGVCLPTSSLALGFPSTDDSIHYGSGDYGWLCWNHWCELAERRYYAAMRVRDLGVITGYVPMAATKAGSLLTIPGSNP